MEETKLNEECKCYFCYKEYPFGVQNTNLDGTDEIVYDCCCKYIKSENLGENFFKWNRETPLPLCTKCLLSAQRLSTMDIKLLKLKNEIKTFVNSFVFEFLKLRQQMRYTSHKSLCQVSTSSNLDICSSEVKHGNEFAIQRGGIGNVHNSIKEEQIIDAFFDESQSMPNNLENCNNEDSISGYISNDDILVPEVEMKPVVVVDNIQPLTALALRGRPKRYQNLGLRRKKFRTHQMTTGDNGKRRLQVNLSKIKFDLNGNPMPNADSVPKRKAALQAAATLSRLVDTIEDEASSTGDANISEASLTDSENSTSCWDDRKSERKKKGRKSVKNKAAKLKSQNSNECHICGKICQNGSKLTVHIRRHTGERPYSCDKCEMAFAGSDDLKKHQQKHSEVREHVCPICKKSFKYRGNMREHLRIVHKTEKRFHCKLCELSFVYMGNGRDERRKHAIECTGRKKETANENTRLNSKQGATGETKCKTIKCRKCFKEFNSKGGLFYHSKTHQKNEEFKCDKCNKVFKNSVTFQNHLLLHKRETHFHCSVCGKEFRSKSGLKDHESSHNTDGSYACETCGQDFITSARLKKHYIVHTDDRPFGPCAVCGLRFRSQSNFNEHLRIHEGVDRKSYECPVCHKHYSTKSSLNKHSFLHGKEKSFSCTKCAKKFHTKEGLQNHAKYHTKEKRFLCDNCGKSFYTKTKLNIHNRIHTGDLFPCTFCEKRFQTTTHLKQHYRSHDNKRKQERKLSSTQEKANNGSCKSTATFETPFLFPCPVCGVQFNDEAFVATHIMHTHLERM